VLCSWQLANSSDPEAFQVLPWNEVLRGIPSSHLPDVLNTCLNFEKQGHREVCSIWVRDGNKYFSTPPLGLFPEQAGIAVERFDAGGVSMSAVLNIYSSSRFAGKLDGNRIVGSFSAFIATQPINGQWVATGFSTPSAEPAQKNLFVLCNDNFARSEQVSIVNSGNHSVRTFPFPDKFVSATLGPLAMAVAPDGMTAWIAGAVTTTDNNTHGPIERGVVYTVDAASGGIATRYFTMPQERFTVGFGAGLSLDGTRLYIAGATTAAPSGPAAVAVVDTVSNRVEAVIPIPASNIRDTSQLPRVALVGTRLYVGSTVVDVTDHSVKSVQPGYNLDGVAAGTPNVFVSGQMFTYGAVGYGTNEIILPDWSKNYVALTSGLQVMRFKAGTGWETVKTIPFAGGLLTISPDSAYLFVTGFDYSRRLLVFTVRTNDDMVTDATPVCKTPVSLAMPRPSGR